MGVRRWGALGMNCSKHLNALLHTKKAACTCDDNIQVLESLGFKIPEIQGQNAKE